MNLIYRRKRKRLQQMAELFKDARYEVLEATKISAKAFISH